MLFSGLRLQNKNIAYRVVGKPKNPQPERPFEWPLELIRSIYMITNSCRNNCELLQAKACSNSIASDFYILLITKHKEALLRWLDIVMVTNTLNKNNVRQI